MTYSRYLAGTQLVCVDRAALRGVVASPVLSAVPDAPAWLPGAFNHLGRAVAAIDAALLLGLGRATDPPAYLLLVEAPNGLLGLIAELEPDEVHSDATPRRGAVLELLDRSQDLLRIDLSVLEQRIEAALVDLTNPAL